MPNIPNTVPGVDLYHGDQVESFYQLRVHGCRVAVLKLGEATEPDPAFASRAKVAPNMGLRVGAYWFVRPDVSTAFQVSTIIKQLPPKMPLFLDLEPSLRVPGNLSSDRWLDLNKVETRQRVLAAFVSTLKVADIFAGLYCTKGFWENVLGAPDGYQAHPWWAARYSDEEPEQAKNLGPWAGWQYSESQSVAGIGNPVDTSIWRKSFWGIS